MNKISFKDILVSEGAWSIKIIKLIDYVFVQTFVEFLPKIEASNLKDRNNIKSVLIIRPGGIGDAVFLLPFINALWKEGIKIDVVCEKRNAGIFNHVQSQLQRIYLTDKLTDILGLLKNEYDVIVDTEQWHFSSAVLGFFIKSSEKLGFDSRRGRNKLYTHCVPYDLNAYEVDNFSKLFESITSSRSFKIEGQLQIDPKLQGWANKQIFLPTVAIYLGASVKARRLSSAIVGNFISSNIRHGYEIILLGGKDVRKLAEEVMSINKNSAYIRDYTGKTTLQEAMALMQKSQKVIGSDSGLMHIAYALGVPTTIIFGPGNIKKWSKPDGVKHFVISLNLPCSPCTRFGYTVPIVCESKYDCLKNLKHLI